MIIKRSAKKYLKYLSQSMQAKLNVQYNQVRSLHQCVELYVPFTV